MTTRRSRAQTRPDRECADQTVNSLIMEQHMLMINILKPGLMPESLGFIPGFIHEDDPRPAKEQFDARYQHGGGWKPFLGFVLTADNSLEYRGDKAMKPWATMQLRDELIVMYRNGWVAIIQPDRKHEVARMD